MSYASQQKAKTFLGGNMNNYTNLIPTQATLVFCKDTWSYITAADTKLKVFLEEQYNDEDVYGFMDFNPHTESINFQYLICCSLDNFNKWYESIDFDAWNDDDEYELFGVITEGWSCGYLYEADYELIDKAREHLGHRSQARAMYDMAKTIGTGKWIFTDIEDANEEPSVIGDDNDLMEWLEEWNENMGECYTSATDFNNSEDHYRLHRQE